MNTATAPDGFAAFETWLGTPLPADPIAAIRILRRQAAQEIERLIAFLDATDGDPDLEGELAGFEAAQDGREGEDTDAEADDADQEPSLAAPEAASCPTFGTGVDIVTSPRSQARWARGNVTELEGDPREDHEDGADDEHSLGANSVALDRRGNGNFDQSGWGQSANEDREGDDSDVEPSLGSRIIGEARSQEVWADGDRLDREPSGDEADTNFSEDGH